MFIPDPNFFPSRIPDPDPGVKKALDPGSATLLWIRTDRGILFIWKNLTPLHISNFIIDFLHIYDVSAYKLTEYVDNKIFSYVLSSLGWECLYLLHTQWLGKLARNWLIAASRINRKMVYSHSKTNIWRKTYVLETWKDTMNEFCNISHAYESC